MAASSHFYKIYLFFHILTFVKSDDGILALGHSLIGGGFSFLVMHIIMMSKIQ